jgi:hypothetical protein
MKTYKLTVVTTFYKIITVEAETPEGARIAAWDWCDGNDPLYGAGIETDLYDVEEVTE